MIQLQRNNVFGTWQGQDGSTLFVLRLDVGKDGALDIVSGDVFEQQGTTFLYDYSFRTTHLEQTSTQVPEILRGPVNIYDKGEERLSRIDVTIPAQGDLDIQFVAYVMTQFGRNTTEVRQFSVSKQFDQLRTIDLEFDQVVGVPVPNAFTIQNHADTPADLGNRDLDYEGAYADAGVQLNVTQVGGDVPLDLTGFDGRWNDEELHAAMEANFATHADNPAWRLYLLLATTYVNPGVLGIMFDSEDAAPRQGSAVFFNHPAISNATGAERDREYLYTIVHELGHAFNLLHAFQKHIFQEGERRQFLARPGSLSWMNYPQLFPYGNAHPPGWNGSNEFWPQFHFGFDSEELEHLRHFHALGVASGGDSFGGPGHREEAEFLPTTEDPDLEFQLWVPSEVEFMAVVEGDVKLRNSSKQDIEIPNVVDLSSGVVELLVQRPGEPRPRVHGGMARACTRGTRYLSEGNSVYSEVTPSFDRLGWQVDRPGTYLVQAVFNGLNGRRLATSVQAVTVQTAPITDRYAADLFTRSAGYYIGLEGSRAKSLTRTSDALRELMDRYPQSVISAQLRRIFALCESRIFKSVEDKNILGEKERSRAAHRLMEALGSPRGQRNISATPTQSHLKIGKQLWAAADAFDRGSEERTEIADASVRFLKSIGAPQSAQDDFAQFAKEVKS